MAKKIVLDGEDVAIRIKKPDNSFQLIDLEKLLILNNENKIDPVYLPDNIGGNYDEVNLD